MSVTSTPAGSRKVSGGSGPSRRFLYSITACFRAAVPPVHSPTPGTAVLFQRGILSYIIGDLADGLLCEDAETARRYLQQSRRRFERTGSRYDARLVEADLLQAGAPCGTGNRDPTRHGEP